MADKTYPGPQGSGEIYKKLDVLEAEMDALSKEGQDKDEKFEDMVAQRESLYERLTILQTGLVDLAGEVQQMDQEGESDDEARKRMLRMAGVGSDIPGTGAGIIPQVAKLHKWMYGMQIESKEMMDDKTVTVDTANHAAATSSNRFQEMIKSSSMPGRISSQIVDLLEKMYGERLGGREVKPGSEDKYFRQPNRIVYKEGDLTYNMTGSMYGNTLISHGAAGGYNYTFGGTVSHLRQDTEIGNAEGSRRLDKRRNLQYQSSSLDAALSFSLGGKDFDVNLGSWLYHHEEDKGRYSRTSIGTPFGNIYLNDPFKGIDYIKKIPKPAVP